MYVDCQSLPGDIILVSHSIQVMQGMLYICEAFDNNFDAHKFNFNKSDHKNWTAFQFQVHRTNTL